MRKITLFFLCALLLAGLAMPASAASNVTFEGGAENYILQAGTQKAITDLFTELKNVMPGDKLTQTVTIQNKSDLAVKLYLKGSDVENSSDELLSMLKLTFHRGGSVLFDAPLDQASQLTDWVFLGTFEAGENLDLTLTLDVPLELDNAFQNEEICLSWVFRVDEAYPETGPDATKPGTDIPETGDPVPLGLLMLIMAGSGGTVCWLGSKRRSL